MKLYDVFRGSKIRIIEDTKTPVASKPIKEGDIITFHRLDGMYSYCTDESGNVIHPAGWTEVELVKEETK